MSFEIEGGIVKIFDTEKKTESFRAREFVIKTEGSYPQFIKFQLTQDRCDLVDKYESGHQVKVYFDLRGREWNEKYFTNLNAWKIEEASGAEQASSDPAETFTPIEGANTGQQEMRAEDFDDLPF